MRYRIGIDPGVKTGFAVWDAVARKFVTVETFGIVTAMERVKFLTADDDGQGAIYIEDARLRKWFGKKSVEVLQGAGSIKRDCSIWEEFCQVNGLRYVMVPPASNKTKLDAGAFAKLTGFAHRTSEHARDAAMLVFGME